jgi:hypothetical protein
VGDVESGGYSMNTLTFQAKVCYNIGAKAVFLVSEDFSFLNSYNIIIFRPSAVTTRSAFASDLHRDTGGRSILNPWPATGPPKNKKATEDIAQQLLTKWANPAHVKQFNTVPRDRQVST